MKNNLKDTKRNFFNVNIGRYMSPNKQQEEIPSKTIIEKQRYEKGVSECNKLRTFIKSVAERSITEL